MPPSQHPTLSATDQTPRLGWRNMYPKPLAWFCLINIILLIVGFILSAIPSHSVWFTVGFFLTFLAPSALFATVGILLAIRHPWGAFFHLRLGRRFAHPRLVGLAMVWAALALLGMVGATVFVATAHALVAAASPRWFAWYPFTASVVAIAPLFALLLFDRRRR